MRTSVVITMAIVMMTLAVGPPVARAQEQPQGRLRGGEPVTLPVDLDGGQARAQFQFELPEGVSGLTAVLRFSPATAPEVVCTENRSVLDGSLDDRPVLDSRRTDAPRPGEPCTQPGRHLLTVLIEDPDDRLGGETVGYELLLSVFGGEPDAAQPTEDTAAEPAEDTAAQPAEETTAAPAEEVAAEPEPRSLGEAIAATAVVVLLMAGVGLLVRRRRTAGP